MITGIQKFDLRQESGVLRTSIAVALLVAFFGIVFGLLARSYSILFDGFYSLIDVGVGLLSLVVANLITAHAVSGTLSKKLRERFSMGFWHLEPMVIVLNGTLLIGASIYAFFNAVSSLLDGGHDFAFGWAIVYAAITFVACVGIAVVERRANRRLRSELLRLDVQSWVMSAAITAALLVAFVFAYCISGTAWAWMTPYVDPAVLALVCLIVAPLPIPSVRRALDDVLMITPADLKDHVDAVARAFVEKHGLVTYRAYTARIGRSKDVEVTFIVAPEAPARTMKAWDALRDEFAAAIGADDPHLWLVVVFTSDLEWAE